MCVGGHSYGAWGGATYWTLQDLRDPLLLLHHVEVLPQVRRHALAAEALGVAVALLGVVAGQGQGEGPRRLSHVHQAHVFASYSSFWDLQQKTLAAYSNIQAVKATAALAAERW